jgi:hypothetical protein
MITGDLVIKWKLLQATDIQQERLVFLYNKAGYDNTNGHRAWPDIIPRSIFYQVPIAATNYF